MRVREGGDNCCNLWNFRCRLRELQQSCDFAIPTRLVTSRRTSGKPALWEDDGGEKRQS